MAGKNEIEGFENADIPDAASEFEFDPYDMNDSTEEAILDRVWDSRHEREAKQ